MLKKQINDDDLVDVRLSLLGQKVEIFFSSNKGSGITLTNNETKDIIKVIKSLENRGILLKGTTRKITGQEGGPLAKNVLLPFKLSAGMSAADAAIQKKNNKNIHGSGALALIIWNE